MKSFTVEVWAKIFNILGWISPFRVVSHSVSAARESYCFVDAWVLSNLLLSIISLLICSAGGVRWWEVIAISYGGVRVFEVIIYQINVLLFDEYRARKAKKEPALQGFRRIVILLLHNYVEILFWFALCYRNMSWAFENCGATLDSFFASLKFSFVTMTTFGYTAFSPKSQSLGDIVTLAQSFIGLFMSLLVLQRFVSLIPSPRSLDES